MENVVSTLATDVSGAILWAEFGKAIGYIAVVMLFAFGYHIIKKLVKGISKGKVSM